MGEREVETNRKQITFDLGESKLKEFYPHPSYVLKPRYYRKAWGDIARFMKTQEFEHRQYSVYTSKNPMTDTDINVLIRKMVNKMPWLNKCLNAIDVTNVGEQHSLMKMVELETINLEAETCIDIEGEIC